jgi:two-component system, NarL family, nitrate/nitrite response regulator NarL
MNSDAAGQRGAPPLRVALAAADPVRRAALVAILHDLGYRLAEPADAEVALIDGAAVDIAGPPVVLLGGADGGQAGVLPHNAAPAQIDAALRAAAVGLSVRMPRATAPTFHALDEGEAPLLTPREVEVLGALGDGLSNKAIARRLAISQHTVKFHVEALFRKLNAVSRADAVHKGLRQRLIEL